MSLHAQYKSDFSCQSDDSNKLNFMIHSTSLLCTLRSVPYQCLAKPDEAAVPPHSGQLSLACWAPLPHPNPDILSKVLQNQILQTDFLWAFYLYT